MFKTKTSYLYTIYNVIYRNYSFLFLHFISQTFSKLYKLLRQAVKFKEQKFRLVKKFKK